MESADFQFGHFGSVEIGSDNGVPYILLIKAPRKYHDDAMDADDKENKVKSDVLFVYHQTEGWQLVGFWDTDDGHDPERQAVEMRESVKLNG